MNVLQGFVVLAVEHADGTAATVQLAGGAGHKFYSGWLSEEERMGQTRHCPCPLLTFPYCSASRSSAHSCQSDVKACSHFNTISYCPVSWCWSHPINLPSHDDVRYVGRHQGLLLILCILMRRYRMRELITAHSLLAAMHEGRALPGLGLGSGLDPGSLFAGRLQMGAVSLMGHSYGGASITALGAEDARFKCGVALDPWWYGPLSIF